MAAQWREKDSHLMTGNTELQTIDTFTEGALAKEDVAGLEMDSHSCLDPSILALLEDSTIAAEAKSRLDEESESTLLTALTEILDSVDETLSPFDTFPDSALFTDQRLRENTQVEADSRPRTSRRSPRAQCEVTQQSNGEEEEQSDNEVNSPSQDSPLTPNLGMEAPQRTENDQEGFTSMSLVNLVKLMHPYCLRVCLEEEGNNWLCTPRQGARSQGGPSFDHRVPLEGEVWRYEKPSDSGESDEEINVDVSDDECPLRGTEEEGVGRDGGDVKPLIGALVKEDVSIRQTPKEKKRVSFGPVLVKSYDISVEAEPSLNEFCDLSELLSEIPTSDFDNCTKTGTTCSHTFSSELSKDNRPQDVVADATVPPQQGETKPRPLSLQQYRLLREHKRLPFVEKQGNHITKWPSLPEPPTELSPIPYLQGPRHPKRRPKTTHYSVEAKSGSGGLKRPASPVLNTVESKAAYSVCASGLKLRRIGTNIISPANRGLGVIPSRTSPQKRSTAVCSDPPNPVLVPLPASPTSDNEIEQQPPLPSTQPSTAPEPKVDGCNRDPNLNSTSLLLEIQRRFSKQPLQNAVIPSKSPTQCPTTRSNTIAQTIRRGEQHLSLSPKNESEALSLPKEPQLLLSITNQTKCLSFTPSAQPPTVVEATIPEKKRPAWALLRKLPPVQPPTSPKRSTCILTPTCHSGIEATDLTSLLEQFEETQAKMEESDPEKSDLEVSPDSSPGRYQQRPTRCSSSTQGMLRLLNAYLLSAQEQFCPSEPDDFPELVSTLEALRTVEPLQAPEPLKTPIVGPLRTPEQRTVPELLRITQPHRTLKLSNTLGPLSNQNIISTQESTLAQHRWKPLPPAAPLKKQPGTPKPPPPKAIQIIEPRPLQPKKTPTSPPKPYTTPRPSQLYTSPPKSPTTPSPSQPPTTPRPSQLHTSPPKSPTTPRPSLLHTSLSQPPTTPRPSQLQTAVSVLSDHDYCVPQDEPVTSAILCSKKQTVSTEPVTNPHPVLTQNSGRCMLKQLLDHKSRSPPRKRFRPRRSESSSSSSSSRSGLRSLSLSPRRKYQLSYSRSRSSRSRSKSWSQSRSRSRSFSPLNYRTQKLRDVYSPTYRPTTVSESRKRKRQEDTRVHKLKAIDERRVVYVGHIPRSMTNSELRERFSMFGEVEEVTLHFRDMRDNYGFVTFYNMADSFAAIEKGSKLRRPDELPFDLSFGGRRHFCKSSYADLDSNREVDPTPTESKCDEQDFDTLLKQAQKGLKS